MGKWTTYLMKVYLGKLCVTSNLIQCKSAIHVICLSSLETCARPPVTPDRAFNVCIASLTTCVKSGFVKFGFLSVLGYQRFKNNSCHSLSLIVDPT